MNGNECANCSRPRRHRYLLALAATLSFCVGSGTAAMDISSSVVTTIKPLHSLVGAVMQGVGEPHLIIRGNASPHTFSLRPSDATVLEDASIVFMIGEALEVSLVGPIETLAADALVVELSEADGMILKPFRTEDAFERQAPEGDEEGKHLDEHADDHHEHGAFDMHLWLDPANASIMVREIADTLSDADPANRSLYETNARQYQRRLEELTRQLAGDLADARGKPFIVFHDAYQYFEDRFGLTPGGSIVVSPEQTPGAKRLLELRDKVRHAGVGCVLAEPQFNPRIVDVIIEGTSARSGSVDPLGSTLESGPDLYFGLLEEMATSFHDCLVRKE